MKTEMRIIAQLVILFSVNIGLPAGELAMLIDAPPTIASADERPVDQAERDELCSKLMQEGQLPPHLFSTIRKNSESVTFSAKYGYILRYVRVESVVAQDGETRDVYSNVVVFAIDGERFHTLIDYSQKSSS